MITHTTDRKLKYKVYYDYGRKQAKFLTKKIAKAFMLAMQGIMISMDDDRYARRHFGEVTPIDFEPGPDQDNIDGLSWDDLTRFSYQPFQHN